MDLEELNKQMLTFQKDFQENQVQSPLQRQPTQYNQNMTVINFPRPLDKPIETVQIKRPLKSEGNFRNDINDKLNQINMNQPTITPNNITPNNITPNNITPNNNQYQNTRNVSNYINTSNYYGQQYPMTSLMDDNYNGYRRVDEKRIDYRQNMNTKVGGFIFDNPNATAFNPILNYQQSANLAGTPRDSRMIIQDSNKDYYRQEANSRLSQYSPLSRASNVPINIANMSVNDFYAGMDMDRANMGKGAKALISSRMNEYSPLAKTMQLPMQQKPKTWIENNVNKDIPLVAHEELPVISH
jgi:hypothetical protein